MNCKLWSERSARETGRAREREAQVGNLQGLRGCAFEEVVDGGGDHQAASLWIEGHASHRHVVPTRIQRHLHHIKRILYEQVCFIMSRDLHVKCSKKTSRISS